MRIGYVVGPGDPNDPLRYSLRSLENVEHDGVSIAGFVPPWVQEVNGLTVPQTGDKWSNIRANIRALCLEHPEWVLMQDDIFTTRPAQIAPLHRGTVAELLGPLKAKNKMTAYLRDVEKTGEVLSSMGYDDPLCYDCIHVPQIIRSDAMLEAIGVAEKHGVHCLLTLHGNLSGAGGERSGNAKALEGWSRRAFVSTSDSRWNAPVGHYIRDLFPTPSRYERSN